MDGSVREDMAQLYPVIGQNPAHKQTAMALVWPALAAKQRDPVLPASAQQALDGRLECG
jgi:hypothetical protein